MTGGRAMRFGGLATVLAATLAGCGEAPAPRVELVQGTLPSPLLSPTALQVFIVTSQECPIANAYAPVLGELARAWQGKPVQFCIVHADPDLDVAAAAQHARDYELPGTVLLDPHHDLIALLGATKTPQAVVRSGGAIVYSGRIDDQWNGLGARGQEASSFDLRDAVAAVLAGGPIAVPQTDVVGCLLPEPKS